MKLLLKVTKESFKYGFGTVPSKSQYFPPERIRNFCIIAHIDHGKSTLADRLLQITNTIPKNSENQFLDKLKVERERGITVQAQTVSMHYELNGVRYLLNLVDTPGHIDFHYQVERSMRACQGALLIIDATQGIQAQTLANFELAQRQKLQILPIMNKIDMICDQDQVEQSIRKQLKFSDKFISKVSAKTGLNVQDILTRIINQIPPPKVGKPKDNLKMFLLNSWFVNGKNVICLFYIMAGTLKRNTAITSMAFNKNYQIFDVGVMAPQLNSQEQLTPGQICYAISNMKQVKQARIGDTFYKVGSKVQAQPGFKPSKPMLFAGVYPLDPDQYHQLQKNLEKLVLTDPAVTFTRQSNATLGNGFRCGFLGLLHMDVFKQRLVDEYNIQAILTAPAVPYECMLKNNKVFNLPYFQLIYLQSALDAPSLGEYSYFSQPMIMGTIVFPKQYIQQIKALCISKRGTQVSQNIIQDKKCILKYQLPLSQIIIDFVDKLKSITHGYGTFEYEHDGFKKADISKMVIHIMNDPIDALTFLVHKKKAYEFGKNICLKLKEQIPAQLFTISIQARISSKTIAAQEIKHIKKNVTAKCYGGDYSRKRKLLQRYKEGKKKLRSIGKVQIHKDTFINVMKQ